MRIRFLNTLILFFLWSLVSSSFAATNGKKALCKTRYALIQESASVLTSSPKKKRPIITDADLFSAYSTILNTKKPGLMSKAILNELKLMAGVKNDDELIDPKQIEALKQAFYERLGQDAYEELLGNSVGLSKSFLLFSRDKNLQDPSKIDFKRSWGFNLIPDDDEIFKDPIFLANMLKSSSNPVQTLSAKNGLHAIAIFSNFEKEWSKLAPKMKVLTFHQTGSDTNNSLYEIASKVASKRLGRTVDGEILSLNGVYAAGNGKMKKLSSAWGINSQLDNKYLVPSPHTSSLNVTDPEEIKRLKILEENTLKEIEKKFKDADLKIGGFLLESILGAKGVYFYRTEFLLKLKQLCTTYNIPLIADEILTGGGRTGKFFAYEHYPGFEPDYVTFGKGLQVSGLASNSQSSLADFFEPTSAVTLRVQDEALLKSTQILKKINEEGFLDNVQKSGQYMLEKLRGIEGKSNQYRLNQEYKWLDRAKTKSEREEVEKRINELRFAETEAGATVRGIGLLLYSQEASMSVSSAMGRLLPPLTITRQQIDQSFK